MSNYKNNSNVRERIRLSRIVHSLLERSGLLWNHAFIPAVIVGIVFFLLAFFTMPDYNIMWDGRNHFFKGQAFAHFFITGKHDYKDLPITKEFVRYYRDYAKSFTPILNIEERLSDDPQFRRSIYKDEVHTFDWLMQRPPTEHPVLSDIGSAFFNIIFYEKLGLLRDDHAYNLYSIVLASILVGVVFYWMYSVYGLFSAIISALTIATTPLFWAESHYNIKDIPLLVFFSLAIYTFWKGTIVSSKKWIIGSALLAGFALGTKFNALFLPFILAAWLVLYYLQSSHLRGARSGHPRGVSRFLVVLYPIIMLGVLYVGWPQLWNNPIGGFFNVINYYRSVGVNIDYTPAFRTIFGISTYPTFWIFVTTYPVVLLLAIVGVIGGIRDIWKKRDLLPLLLILWLAIPIIRASLPNTSIFGGVRHIIEYIPPLAMLAGIGAGYMVKLLRSVILERSDRISMGSYRSPKTHSRMTKARNVSYVVIYVFVILLFIPFIITLIRLHPAENVYFNSFIGGLPGAKKANLTGWGNTDGGIYKKAVLWINEHAEKGAHLAVGFSELADFYLPEFREDLRADNNFSGYLQNGEYIIALTHNSELEHTYRMLYPEKFLTPVYVYEIDGVPLVKIWKNDKKYLRDDLKSLKEYKSTIDPRIRDGKAVWDLGEIKKVVRVEFNYRTNKSCKDISLGYFRISRDGKIWTILPEMYPSPVVEALGVQPKNNFFVAPIAGLDARYVAFVSDPVGSCVIDINRSSIIYL